MDPRVAAAGRAMVVGAYAGTYAAFLFFVSQATHADVQVACVVLFDVCSTSRTRCPPVDSTVVCLRGHRPEVRVRVIMR